MAINGKKSGAQLDSEISDILAACQKREARTRVPKDVTIRPNPTEYERRELSEARQRLTEVERAPLADRKEAAAEFLEAMREYPELVAERVGWLLNGSYGYGSKMMARQILHSTRMNRSAALTHMVAAFEWSAPNVMVRAGWKKLTKAEQDALENEVLGAIQDAESTEAISGLRSLAAQPVDPTSSSGRGKRKRR